MTVCLWVYFLKPAHQDDVVLGTDMTKGLRARGFKGLIVIRSGNVSKADVLEYMESGGADGVVGKEVSLKQTALLIRDMFREKKEKTGASRMSERNNSNTGLN
jgi:hypothetical protein